MVKRQTILLAVINILTFIVGGLFWLSWENLLFKVNPASLSLVSLSTTVLLSLLALFAYVNDKVLFSLLLGFLASSTVFFRGFEVYKILAFLVFFTAVVTLNSQIKSDKAAYIKIYLFKLLRPLRLTFSLLALSISLFYYPFAVKSSQQIKVAIPAEFFNPIYEGVIQSLGPLNPQILDPQSLKKLTESQIQNWLINFQKYIPAVRASSLFLTISFFSYPAYLLTTLLVGLYLKILVKFGVLRINKQTVETERVVLAP